MAYAAGTDVVLAPSEPYNEIGLTDPLDPLYLEQSGFPRDPQPGNIGGVLRDDRGGPNLDCGCDFVALIHIEKLLSTLDGTLTNVAAQTGNGPELAPATPIYWTYLVTNPTVGSTETPLVPLQITRIRDDSGTAAAAGDDFTPRYVSGDTDGDGLLDQGETWVFTSQGVVAYNVRPGLYINTVTVEASARNGVTTADTATHRHTSTAVGPPPPTITVVKAVNAVDPLNPTAAEDADVAPGLVVPVGAPLVFTYLVSTASTVGVGSVVVRDDSATTDPGDDFTAVYVSGDVDADGVLESGETWLFRSVGSLTARAGTFVNMATVSALPVGGGVAVSATDVATVTGRVGELLIVKAVNAVDPLSPTVVEDANDPPGPSLTVGSAVTWTYAVSALGVAPVVDVVVTDDRGVAVTAVTAAGGLNVGDIDADGRLDPGEVWLFRASGTVVEGAYRNVGTVTGTETVSNRALSDVDAANHVGVVVPPPTVTVVKAVNAVDPLNPTAAEDADVAPGLVVPVGAPLVFTYLVSTGSSVGVGSVVVRDDSATADPGDDFTAVYVSGDVDADGVLESGETWLFRSVGSLTARAGTFVNMATVSALPVGGGVAVSATDVATVTGRVGELHIVKAVNAVDAVNPTAVEDANDPPGPSLTVGSAVTWTYAVSTLGVAPVVDVVVTDDRGAAVTAVTAAGGLNVGDVDADGRLDPGEVWLFRATGTVVEGPYRNVGTVTGTETVSNRALTDTDPANHVGVAQPPTTITIVKAVNAVDPLNPTAAEDADVAPGLVVPVGAPLVFTYLVSTASTVGVGSVVVRDDNATTDLADDFSAVYVSGDTDADGVLEAGETWLFRSVGSLTARAGTFVNTATASAVPLVGDGHGERCGDGDGPGR